MNESDIHFGDEGTGDAPAPAQRVALIANPFEALPQASAMAAIESSRAIAEMQTERLLARKFPRDPREAMDSILRACTIPDLAEVATFNYVRGGENISAPSIRLAEAVCQSWGNMKTGVVEVAREGNHSTVRSFAVDLQTGFYDEKIFQVKHWRDTKGGGYPLKDERDIYELVANMAARRKRSCITAVIPREVFNLAVQQCDVTLNATAKTDKSTVQIMLDRFAEFGVLQEHVERKIQRHLDNVTPGQMVLLRKVYNSLHDGMGKPWDYFDLPEPDVETVKAGRTIAEIVGSSGGSDDTPPVNYDSIKAMVSKATTIDALDEAESLLGALNEADRAAASNLILVKRDALKEA